jgi:ubiquinone/menaquinone biosynthesis C-methylase UbiE
LPNDNPEIERLNEQHWIFTQAKQGRIYNAPIDPTQAGFRILDIGCGSGIWCIQMADAFPDCTIVGMDISPIQAEEKPSNVEWMLHNVETELPFPNDEFDYVRLSLLNGSFADFGKTMKTIVQYVIFRSAELHAC